MALSYSGRVPPSEEHARRNSASVTVRRQPQKPLGQGRAGALHAETFSASALKKQKARKRREAAGSFPAPTERLKFRFWARDDFDIAKQLWADDRVNELLGGPFAVLPLGNLRKRARLKGASDEQMAAAEAAGDDLEKKENLAHLISECELAHAHLHEELSPCGTVQELRDQAVQLRLDAEIRRQEDQGVQLYPVFLLDPIPEMLTRGGGSVGCVGLRQKNISPWLEDVERTFGPGLTAAFEIACHIRPPYWRRGLATEAASAVLEHAFTKLNADMITASYDPDNVAAQQLLRKLGFQYVGMDVYSEIPNAADEQIEMPTQALPEEEKRLSASSFRASSFRSPSSRTPRLAIELAPEPEPEPEPNQGLGLTGMFGWGTRRPTYVLLRSEHADRLEAAKAFPALEQLFETMIGIGEGSEFHLRRQIREEGWTLRDLQRRAQRAGFNPDSEAFQKAMASDNSHEGIVQLLVDNTIYHTKVQITQAVTDASNALCSLLCLYLKAKLLEDDVNTRHRTVMARLFRKQLREHCMEAIGKMVDYAGSTGTLGGRQTELDAILHNHATIVMKEVAYQPNDEVEAFVPTTPEDIFAAMDKDGDGEASKEEFAEAMRSAEKKISDEEIDRIFEQLDTDGGGTLSMDDGQVQAGGETTHSGTWARAIVMEVGPTHISVQLHPDQNTVVAPQRSLSDLGSPGSELSSQLAPPPPRARLQIPWVQLHEIGEGEDPGELMLTRIRLVSDKALAEEKQAANERAAALRAKRQREAKEAAARGESLTRMAKVMWAQKGKVEPTADDPWEQGTNIDAFIKKHDVRTLKSSSEADKAKEKVKHAAMLLSAGARQGK